MEQVIVIIYLITSSLRNWPSTEVVLFWTRWCLLEQTDKQVLEAKTSENTGKVYGEQYTPSAEKRTYYFDNNYAVKTGWTYEDGQLVLFK